MVEFDATILQGACDFQRGDRTGDAVEAAAIGNGVGMRAHKDRAEAGLGALAPADQVAGGIHSRLKSCGFHPCVDIGASFQKERREGTARPGMARLGNAGQRIDVFSDTVGVDGQVVALGVGHRAASPART